MPQLQSVKSKSFWHWMAIVGLASSFFLVGFHRIPVPTVDGAVRASMARHIVQTGELWPIQFEGRVFTDHPPLFVWCTALSFKLFGINDFAANLVPRLFAALTVIVTALIAVESGLSAGMALVSVLIVCLTRDFVLSSVRGYIEPVLGFFIYAAIYFSLRQINRKHLVNAAAAGICIWLAAYAKGPVALWPFLFCILMLGRSKATFTYLTTFLICTGIWAIWVNASHQWNYWQDYLTKQVLGSALDGRGGAQQREPFYFILILLKFYWPWIPLFAWACIRTLRARKINFELAALILAAGFIVGFSIPKWKFWYYIAPAYPAMALLIASSFRKTIQSYANREAFARALSYGTCAWIVVGTALPIPLHHERVAEVHAFKDSIRNSTIPGPVWFLHDPADHNMIATSGNWYFDRIVEKVEDEAVWQNTKLKAPAWIITGTEYYKSCEAFWCAKSDAVVKTERSVLLRYTKNSNQP